MWAATDGKKIWIGKDKVNTGKGTVDPKNPPEWARVFPASFLDKLTKIKRGPAVINKKDIGTILSLTGLGSDWKVAEGGSGSGYLTLWLSRLVKKVYSYEVREDHYKIAKKNVDDFKAKNVLMKNKSIFELSEKNLDMVLYDLPNPWEGVDAAYSALKTGGYFVCYLPTVNQVRQWLISTRLFKDHQIVSSTNIEWKTEPDKLRPMNSGLTHTAFICVTRKIPRLQGK
ncbi:MAG: hypothetical protein GOU98_02150 [Candidatus Altiarchaeota archaeon]|nr:hypothetical protein [Candidatus Altiarchaeota archaeon]